MDNEYSFDIEIANKPLKIAVVIYVIVKTLFFMLLIGQEWWIPRFIANILLLLAVLLITKIKKLSRRQLSVLLPYLLVVIEITHASLFGGDRILYIFLMAVATTSLLYMDSRGLLIMGALTVATTGLCVFVLDIQLLGEWSTFYDELYNFFGLVIFYIAMYVFCIYTCRHLIYANQAKSKFLATMSHEIRTPMNAIIGIAQMQMQKGTLTGEDAEAYGKIFNSGRLLLGIINDILDLSKIETGKMELSPTQYGVPSLISDTVQLNKLRIGAKPIEFILDIDETMPSKLYGDELRLKQILNNLLSNAIKYTEKGFVKLSVGYTLRGDDVALRFMVEDTGRGMKPEYTAKLFTEYLRFDNNATRSTEGTGLGLVITKHLVELMGGTIDIQSEYGKGSVFTATVRQKAVECGKIGSETADLLRNFKYDDGKKSDKQLLTRHPMPYGKVLIVDDVESNLYVAKGLIALYEMEIETASSGFEAIDIVENGGAYDVIFMDHMMPLMDGIETTGKLRALGYTDAIVALTANALVGNEEMFRKNGFDDFISKPIDIKELDAVLNKFIRDRHPDEAKKYAVDAATVDVEEIMQNEVFAITPKLIEVFLRSAGKSAATLRGAAASGDTKLFATIAHGMKSALTNIGEQGMREVAFALEKAGLDGDTDFIAANLDAFIESIDELCERLRAQGADVGGRDPALQHSRRVKDAAPYDYLAPQLQIIKAACETYDDEAAFAALDLLKDAPLGADTAAALEEIRDMLFLDSDFDAAAERTREMLERSSNA